jgi:hypothetical protein
MDQCKAWSSRPGHTQIPLHPPVSDSSLFPSAFLLSQNMLFLFHAEEDVASKNGVRVTSEMVRKLIFIYVSCYLLCM